MSLRLAVRFAARELRSGLAGFRIFLACLAFGVAAIAAVGTVRAAIENGLAEAGATLLGGDAQMEFTYRTASPEERVWMQVKANAVSEIYAFRSMAVVDRSGTTERALTQVKAVDDAYPLTGHVVLSPDMPLSQALAGHGAVMDPVLADRLGLAPGDMFRLGTQDFTLRARLVKEPDAVAGGIALGPRTLVRSADLATSGLLAPGTLFNTRYRLDLPDNADLAATARAAKAKFADDGMRWSDARNGAPGTSEFIRRVGSFLILVGLSGLAVGGIGVSSAVRSYIAEKTTAIATLRTLGAESRVIFQTYFLQIGALSVLGIAIGLVLGALVPVLLAPVISAQLPIPARFTIYPAPLAEAALYGILTAFLFTLWPLARTRDVRPAALFRGALSRARLLPAPGYVAAAVLALALLLASAGWFSGSWRLTLWTAGGIAGALALLTLAASLIRNTAHAMTRQVRGKPILRWALSAIAGRHEGAGLVVISLGLGLSVLAAVGQIDGNLRRAISGNLPDVAPSYFFVDIQKDQMPQIAETLGADTAVTRLDSAPMLRGVITRINDRPAQDVAPGHWVLQGDRGVTYAATPPRAGRITAGTWWPENYTGPPLISFAAEEAEEMGLKLGDTLTINVLSRDITGTISNFREVDFSTAGIGFILTMTPNALAGAPHSFIATVYADEEAEARILRDLASRFPNITAIRVRDAIDRVADVLSGLAAATSYGAAATLLTGALVLIGAAAAGTRARIFEAAVLKTLGATRAHILRSFALRSALLGACAGFVALMAGIAGGWAVCHFVLETDFTVIWPNALAIIAGGTLATLLASLAFTLAPLAARPARVLRTQE